MKDQAYEVGGNPQDVVAADFSGDGNQDLAVVNQASDTVSILTNDGSGTFQVSQTLEFLGTPRAIVARDFDDDNDLDLAVGVLWHQEQTSRLTLWWNQLHKRDQ